MNLVQINASAPARGAGIANLIQSTLVSRRLCGIKRERAPSVPLVA